MARYMAEEKESTFFTDVFKVSLGVFIGGLLAALVFTEITAWRIEQAAVQGMAQLKLEQQKRNAQQEQARKASEFQRMQQEAQKQVAQQELHQQALQRQHEQQEQKAFTLRREAAWRRSFKPTQLCLDDPLTTECIDAANVSMRRFYAQYKD